MHSPGNNIIHILIVMSLMCPDKEEAMVSTYQYMTELLNKDALKELLMMENDQGLRPVEHSSNVGAFRMFTAIMETKGKVFTF